MELSGGDDELKHLANPLSHLFFFLRGAKSNLSSQAGLGHQGVTGLLPHLQETDQLQTTIFGVHTGTLTPLSAGPFNSPFDLVDYPGQHPASFFLEPDHRGWSGLSGNGWVNHSGVSLDRHVAASDWLFTVGAPIPEPDETALFCFGALLVGFGIRRQLSLPS